jgi:hypothetical protein
MGRIPQVVGGASILLVPVLAGTGGALAMLARPPEPAGTIDTDYGVETQLADLSGIAEHPGLFTLAAALFYATALMSVPALVAVWRLSVDRSRRWAWAGAVVATLGVVGQVGHLGYFGQTLAAVGAPDRRAAAEFLVHTDSTPFVLALFLPFLLWLVAPVVQAVALRRAGAIPLRATVAISLAAVLMLAMGNVQWSNALWALLMVAGFLPAARAMLRGQPVDAPPARTPTATPA